MLTNYSITVQNCAGKLTELLIVEVLVLKITTSNVVSEKRKLDDNNYLGQFLLRFHALIDVYPADFLG